MPVSKSIFNWMRHLIWVYFWLLIFEGSLRKWGIPALSNALLIIRDPVVIAIYVLAVRARVFPSNWWVYCCGILAGLCLFAGLYILQGAFGTALYGWRADFLHLPLIFIIPRLFDIADVKRLGFWCLTLCAPMGLLMIAQFEAPSTSWINAGAGEGASQISGGMGHIRPAGTFSFINGVEGFFALSAAFLLYCQFVKPPYPRLLLISSLLALLVGVAVTSSRGTAGSILVVLACALFTGMFLQQFRVSQTVFLRTLQGLCAVGLVGFIALQFSVFGEGMEAFNARMDAKSGSASVLTGRVTDSFTQPVDLLSDTPLLGEGLGLGTNAGVALNNNGKVGMTLAEGEWARVILESGPLLGSAYLLLRVILVLWLGGTAVRIGRQGNVLPFLIFGSCVPLLLSGQFGQPSELGFAVLGAGLTLAAMRLEPQTVHLQQNPVTANWQQEVHT